MALLAEVAKDLGQTPLVPLPHHVAGAQRLRGIHAHVKGGVVGVGESASPRVDLHRGHAEIEVGHVGAHALAGQLFERLGVARANEAQRARRLGGQRGEALLGQWIAVDCHERAAGTQVLGEQAGVAAVAEGAVDSRLAGLRVEQPEQLAGQHRRVRPSDGDPPRP